MRLLRQIAASRSPRRAMLKLACLPTHRRLNTLRRVDAPDRCEPGSVRGGCELVAAGATRRTRVPVVRSRWPSDRPPSSSDSNRSSDGNVAHRLRRRQADLDKGHLVPAERTIGGTTIANDIPSMGIGITRSATRGGSDQSQSFRWAAESRSSGQSQTVQHPSQSGRPQNARLPSHGWCRAARCFDRC